MQQTLMRRIVLAAIAVLLLCPHGSSAQVPATTTVDACAPTSPDVTQTASVSGDVTLHVQYCVRSSDPIAPTHWAHHLSIDGGVTLYELAAVTCQSQDPVIGRTVCSGTIPSAAAAILVDGAMHALQLSVNDGTEGRRSAATPYTTGDYSGPMTGCIYIPPGGGVVSVRPVGQTMQGYNAIGTSGTDTGQAKRISDLRRWGWVVELALDATNQKVLLIIVCPVP